MKWYCVVATVLIASISVSLFGQSYLPSTKLAPIVPYELEVTYNKTTNLVFPSAILSIDRGSADIVVEKAVGVDNILRVKADILNFSETNLTVITNTGTLYSFLVNYSHNPAYLNIKVDDSRLPDSLSVPGGESTMSPVINGNDPMTYTPVITRAESNIRVKDKSARMVLELNGFYVKGSFMFCRLMLENNSMIDYDIDQLRLYLKDKEQAKRTASQELEIQPLAISGDTVSVKSLTEQSIIIAVPKFTIPRGKFLFIEIMEENGGRNLALRVKNKQVLKANSL